MTELIHQSLSKLYNQDIPLNLIQVQKTRKEFEGDLTLVVFPLLRTSKKSPEETANQIGTYLSETIDEIIDFNVVKGFLNLSINDTYWLNEFKQVTNQTTYGYGKRTGETYIVEYSSPNTNKPLHLGHLRNIFLGYAVANILDASGHDVVKTQIINDRGIHICKSMIAWQKFGEGETPQSSGLKGDKLAGKYYVAFDKAYKKQIDELVSTGLSEEEAKKQAPILLEAQEMLRKWEAKDPEVYALWQKMNGWVYEGFDVTYNTMGVNFDKLYYESDTYLLGKDIVEKGLAEGIFYQKEDQSIWCDLSDHKMDDKLLLRSDGTSVYMTQDIGTAVERFKDYPSTKGMVYTVGNEQDHHFKVLFTILKKLGYDFAKNCFHLSYGMVDLPTGKMKSREGTVVDADDIMAEITSDAKEMTQERGHLDGLSDEDRNNLYHTIGVGGLKYFLLKVDPKKRILFDPAESIDLNGNTAPFIQYGYARIQSILRKEQPTNDITSTGLTPEEKELITIMLDYPEVIQEAAKSYNPSIVCNYAFDLVKTFNSFYQSTSILGEEDQAVKNTRLLITKEVAKTVKSAMDLLGIDVPNQM